MSLELLQKEYEALRAKAIKLDLTRGKPAPEQLELSNELLALPGTGDFTAEGATDVRNYGGLQGLAEARKLLSSLLGAPAEQVVLANNASLSLMHDTIIFSLVKGNADSAKPWGKEEEISLLCPVPGYDRHFRICEDYGIEMIPVAMNADGPDMDEVERLVAADASIRGIWCVPKYSNPTGAVYSDAVIERLASMKTAAKDFRIFWDNAYGVHHLTDEKIEIANILERAAAHGNANRPFVFASTSKITFSGAGIGGFAASKENVAWLLARLTPRTIGPDKVNQLRHVRFLKDAAGIAALMEKHRALLAPKFAAVEEIFAAGLTGLKDVSWTKPKGGYFTSLDVPAGCAKRVVSLAKDAGVVLTPAGATHPYGKDEADRTIRIAPSFPKPEDVRAAAEAVVLCVKLACAEKEAGVLEPVGAKA
ncbi:aminotransferase class I/II-fold pyridoxal phosphate-dependent enzyme [Silvibacterium dinghuense]|uniref:Aminotransferase class I/II-fold pyridoxal phosphate-dependent enzyme n=1 Tax=Silvibacterium dinghuense TaxID=1560006 RepID=A0A4Q1SHM4_9BACT|nr:aminotransferase class I/II-fold pyridoxal phosphate-dependent enzyme [Silvibacterium dinghuense]RXS96889.1 aminotransferase class I/II-fold pyridoxal phosphate-dependent enzyme [Silvibacterium dinghuense]GGG94456.1 aminotransferase [Silvibacterium dinghuense]